jgi:hypothetical protein
MAQGLGFNPQHHKKRKINQMIRNISMKISKTFLAPEKFSYVYLNYWIRALLLFSYMFRYIPFLSHFILGAVIVRIVDQPALLKRLIIF